MGWKTKRVASRKPREKVFQEVGTSHLDKVLLRDGDWEVISLSTTFSSVLKAQLGVILFCLSPLLFDKVLEVWGLLLYSLLYPWAQQGALGTGEIV